VGNIQLYGLNSLVFEFGRELSSIGASSFLQCSATSICLPRSVGFIGRSAFQGSNSLARVYFDRDIWLRQLKSDIFSYLYRLLVITIPASVRQIHNSAFSSCNSLPRVTFAFHSQCWSIGYDSFAGCNLLDSVILPPSVEVIDQGVTSYSLHIPRHIAQDHPHFCVENDCFTNGRQLLQYHGSSEAFCVNRNITALFAGSFLGNSTLTMPNQD
jgi:hypothetical protein